MENNIALQFVNISKAFGNKIANKNVSLDLRKGEILAILGENGSGKTTLMNAAIGIYYPDEGQIFVNGEEASIHSPKDAYNYHIGMIHQHFKLVDVFTAKENVILGLSKEDYKKQEEATRAKQDLKLQKIRDEEGREPTKEELRKYNKRIKDSKSYNLEEAKRKIIKICKTYGFEVDPDKKVYEMSVSEKQTLEIVKALYKGIDILILDEPTAVLTPQETRKLFNVLRNMASQGKSIIIITHKLNEVLEISDRVSVLRKGEYAGTVITKETNEKELTELMVGRKIELNIKRPAVKNPHDRLFINGLSYTNREGVKALDDVSFVARGGEILGIAGIAGNGQRELLEGIAGLVRLDSGDIVFHNPKKNKPVTFFHHNVKQIRELAAKGALYDADTKETLDLRKVSTKKIKEMVENEKIMFYEDEIIDLRNKKPIEIRNLGIKLSFVPEDRLGMGLVGNMDIIDNMMLRSFRKGHSIFVNRKKPKYLAEEIVDELEVVTPNLKTPVRNLSGGNIQKLLVGREISSSPKVLMVAYPVRGLDIKSSYTIYDLLNAQKERGTAVVFVGEDLDVLLALSDRILVLSGGKVAGIVDARKTTKEEIGLLMTKSIEKQEVLYDVNAEDEEE